ncbi:MAG: hypothetical protein J2P37_00210 [Ktedonobacteraceae bacterium]|nr:hypothetical protein [Ktedonobacteraceae bacterium]
MGKGSKPIRYALIVRDADGDQLNGTTSTQAIEGTRRMARQILRMLPGAAFVDVYHYDHQACQMAPEPCEMVNLDQEGADDE